MFKLLNYELQEGLVLSNQYRYVLKVQIQDHTVYAFTTFLTPALKLLVHINKTVYIFKFKDKWYLLGYKNNTIYRDTSNQIVGSNRLGRLILERFLNLKVWLTGDVKRLSKNSSTINLARFGYCIFNGATKYYLKVHDSTIEDMQVSEAVRFPVQDYNKAITFSKNRSGARLALLSHLPHFNDPEYNGKKLIVWVVQGHFNKLIFSKSIDEDLPCLLSNIPMWLLRVEWSKNGICRFLSISPLMKAHLF